MVATQDVVELLALCRVPGASWYFLAREAQRPGGLDRLRRRRPAERGSEATESLAAIEGAKGELADHRRVVEELLERTEADRVGLTTVLHEDYPANLRTIYNLPPFLFYRGELRAEDARAVAVVGARTASASRARVGASTP